MINYFLTKISKYDIILSIIDKYSSKNSKQKGRSIMTTTKDLRLARLVKTLLDIVYGGLVFACIALVLWIMIFPVIAKQADFIGTASVPVLIGSGEEPQFEVMINSPAKDAIHASFVEGAEGTLRLETSSFLLILIANLAKLFIAIGLAYVFYLLRGIVQSILDGNPFASENGQRIRRLGYAVLLLGILQPSIEHLAATEILNRLPTTTPILNPGSTFNIEVILTSLLILLLAYVWSYGLELEHDKALTV
jgi:hypothetical protein